jgi:hypothetical protein
MDRIVLLHYKPVDGPNLRVLRVDGAAGAIAQRLDVPTVVPALQRGRP